MATKRDQIVAEVVNILKQNPKGVRYSELITALKQALPEIPVNTIHGTVWDLEVQEPDQIYKPERGLYLHASFKGQATIEEKRPTKMTTIKEESFYASFADYLKGELGDCTEAIALGGKIFGDKWGTPDVIGKDESKKSDIIKHETEIISAEIKTDDAGLITAFGQACAYKSFSHKVYIVIPKIASEEDKSRIESLCMIFGIGLILFDRNSIENPAYEIRVRPLKHEPDNFYVNKYLKLIEDKLF